MHTLGDDDALPVDEGDRVVLGLDAEEDVVEAEVAVDERLGPAAHAVVQLGQRRPGSAGRRRRSAGSTRCPKLAMNGSHVASAAGDHAAPVEIPVDRRHPLQLRIVGGAPPGAVERGHDLDAELALGDAQPAAWSPGR